MNKREREREKERKRKREREREKKKKIRNRNKEKKEEKMLKKKGAFSLWGKELFLCSNKQRDHHFKDSNEGDVFGLRAMDYVDMDSWWWLEWERNRDIIICCCWRFVFVDKKYHINEETITNKAQE